MNIGPLRQHLAISATFFLLLASTAFGQTPGTGAISGTVYDPLNRVVANAEVVVINEATHVSRSVTTTAKGMFRVPLLLPGAYTVTVSQAGFAPNTSHSIQVTVSETASLNVTLAIAAVNQSVQVAKARGGRPGEFDARRGDR